MSAEEASLQLQVEPEPFLLFMNASTSQINVIYKEYDGNHVLAEPEI